MTKIPHPAIIAAFPCSGKSTASQRFKNVIDLESSRYMFTDPLIDNKYQGNEEAAKGDPTRELLPDANERYLAAIVAAAAAGSYDYILCGPTALADLLELEAAGVLAYPLYLVQPEWREGFVDEFVALSVGRGNSEDWRAFIVPRLKSFHDAK